MIFIDCKKLWKEHELIDYMSRNLSKKNREEAELLYPTWSISELLTSLAASSDWGFALLDEQNNPYGIGGIADDGNIFFVVREELDMANNISALKQARKWLAQRLKNYPELWGYCWEKSEDSMRWMRWLGFDFAPIDSPANMKVREHTFIYFRLRRSKK